MTAPLRKVRLHQDVKPKSRYRWTPDDIWVGIIIACLAGTSFFVTAAAVDWVEKYVAPVVRGWLW